MNNQSDIKHLQYNVSFPSEQIFMGVEKLILNLVPPFLRTLDPLRTDSWSSESTHGLCNLKKNHLVLSQFDEQVGLNL